MGEFGEFWPFFFGLAAGGEEDDGFEGGGEFGVDVREVMGFEGKISEEEGFEAEFWKKLEEDIGGVGHFALGGEGDFVVVGEGGEFAGVGAAEFIGGVGEEGHDAGAGEALEVEEVVVMGFADLFYEFNKGFEAFFAMEKEGVVNGVALGDDGGEAVADHPVDAAIGELFFDGLGDLEAKDDVAK